MQHCLGLASYYWCFIHQFTSWAAPLTTLLQKGQPKWSSGHQKPWLPLRTYRLGCHCLQSQCSKSPACSSLRSVHRHIWQRHRGSVVTRHHSRGTVLELAVYPWRTKYATVEKEALAVKWVIEMLCYYLWCVHFTVIMNHAPLSWLKQMKDTHTQLTHWYLALQPYAFTVKHCHGKDHTNADVSLTRWPRGSWTRGPNWRRGCHVPALEASYCPVIPPPPPFWSMPAVSKRSCQRRGQARGHGITNNCSMYLKHREVLMVGDVFGLHYCLATGGGATPSHKHRMDSKRWLLPYLEYAIQKGEDRTFQNPWHNKKGTG